MGRLVWLLIYIDWLQINGTGIVAKNTILLKAIIVNTFHFNVDNNKKKNNNSPTQKYLLVVTKEDPPARSVGG